MSTFEKEAPWVVAFIGGRCVVGQLNIDGGGKSVLGPVYDFMAMPIPAPTGALGSISYSCTPMGWLLIRKVTLPEGTVIVPLTELARFEQSGIMAAINAIEAQVQVMRAQAAGITIEKIGNEPPVPTGGGGLRRIQ